MFCYQFFASLYFVTTFSFRLSLTISSRVYTIMRECARTQKTKNDIRLHHCRRHTLNTTGSQFTHKPCNYHLIIILSFPASKTADFQAGFSLYLTPQRYNFFLYPQHKSYIFLHFFELAPNAPKSTNLSPFFHLLPDRHSLSRNGESQRTLCKQRVEMGELL